MAANKSALRELIREKFEDHEVEEHDLREDLLDSIGLEFGEDFVDDEEEEEGDEG